MKRLEPIIKRIASMILAEGEGYLYDPRHEMSKTDASRALGGQVHETSKGWGLGEPIQIKDDNNSLGVRIEDQVAYIDRLIGTSMDEQSSSLVNQVEENLKIQQSIYTAEEEKFNNRKIAKKIVGLIQELDLGIDENEIIGKPLNHNITCEDYTVVKSKEHLEELKNNYAEKSDQYLKKANERCEAFDRGREMARYIRTRIRDVFLKSLYSKPDNPIEKGLAYVDSDEDKALHARVIDGIEWASKAIDWKKTASLVYLHANNETKRPHYEGANAVINLTQLSDSGVYLHELGHHLEMQNPSIRHIASTFYEKRTRGRPLSKLKFLDQDSGNRYEEEEYARDDSFISKYTGKVYKDGSTEIISMGLEHMFRDPVEFRQKDPEHFEITLKALRLVRHDPVR